MPCHIEGRDDAMQAPILREEQKQKQNPEPCHQKRRRRYYKQIYAVDYNPSLTSRILLSKSVCSREKDDGLSLGSTASALRVVLARPLLG